MVGATGTKGDEKWGGRSRDGVRSRRLPLPSFHFSVTVLLLTGCATMRSALSFQEPQIQLQEIHVTGMGLTGGTLDLVFDVYNPNGYRLRSTRLEVGLELEGSHFGDA